MKNVEPEEHESYIVVEVSNISYNNGTALYGSDLNHRDTIRLSVHKSRIKREYNRNWFTSDEKLIEIEMSPDQFARMITVTNSTPGVPATLRYYDNKSILECPFKSYKETIESEINRHLEKIHKQFSSLADYIQKLIDKSSVTKKERKTLASKVGILRQEVSSNFPYMIQTIEEHITKMMEQLEFNNSFFKNDTIEKLSDDVEKLKVQCKNKQNIRRRGGRI